MRLTLHADYALRVLLYLATHQDRYVTTAEISEVYNISRNHLVRVVQKLGKVGFVNLQQGRSGGIVLAVDPKQITLGQVFRLTEPDFYLVECFDHKRNTCPITPVCALQSVLYEAKNAFLAVLDKYTLQDTIKGENGERLEEFFSHLIQIRSNASPARRGRKTELDRLPALVHFRAKQRKDGVKLPSTRRSKSKDADN